MGCKGTETQVVDGEWQNRTMMICATRTSSSGCPLYYLRLSNQVTSWGPHEPCRVSSLDPVNALWAGSYGHGIVSYSWICLPDHFKTCDGNGGLKLLEQLLHRLRTPTNRRASLRIDEGIPSIFALSHHPGHLPFDQPQSLLPARPTLGFPQVRSP